MTRAYSRGAAALALAALLSTAGAHAQAAPALPKLINVVVPFPPGGSNDVFARVLSDKLSARMGTSVMVENRPGAGGAIGAEYVARAPADGSVLLLSSSTFATNAAVQPNLKYDAVKSFAPVAMLASSPMTLVVPKDSPYRTMADLLAAARKAPGKLNYGSAGVGSINQMGSEILASDAGVTFTHVPYKGMSQAMNDLAAGRVDFVVASFASVAAMVKAERIRILAVTSGRRSTLQPDVPTVGETVPGYGVELWWGILAPAGTPPALVEKLNADVRAVVADPKMRDIFAEESATASDFSAARFAKLVADDAAQWKKIATDRHIVAQ